MSQELFKKLKLFIQSPNGKHNVGEEREKWIPNPKANSFTDLENFYKIGFLMAVCFKLQDCLELSLPSIFWKYFLTGSLDWEDVKTINVNQVVCLEKIQNMSEDDLEYLEETFLTFLGDGLEYELEVGGKSKRLTIQNKHEYIEKCKQVQLAALIKPFEMIKRGFMDSSFNYFVSGISHCEMDHRICGMDYVS
jgi:hypothetical protein